MLRTRNSLDLRVCVAASTGWNAAFLINEAQNKLFVAIIAMNKVDF